jgi:hypothetical protein
MEESKIRKKATRETMYSSISKTRFEYDKYSRATYDKERLQEDHNNTYIQKEITLHQASLPYIKHRYRILIIKHRLLSNHTTHNEASKIDLNHFIMT